MISKSLRGLCVLFAFSIIYSANTNAQFKTTTFNDNLVKENSIVVKFDDTMITTKHKAVSPKRLAADVRTQFNASIGRTLENGTEEWIINHDMNTVLNELNRIPGVRAFPNYVFYRDGLKVTELDFSDQITLTTESENLFPELLTMYGDEIIINGDFGTGDLSNWQTFVADWVGVTADFAVENGIAQVDSIAGGLDGTMWYIQLNQALSDAQLDQLNVGARYELSFDAFTDSAFKEISVVLGQNGGDFFSVVYENMTINRDTTNYTILFNLTEKWDNSTTGMKLGFEGGLSDASMFIDNVSLRQANSPASALPGPGVADSMVVSIFSDDYIDVAVDTYRTPWSSGFTKFSIDSVDNNKFITYDSLDFVGIEMTSTPLDISEMTHVYFNVWTPNTDVMRIKLVDFGDDGTFGGGDDSEHEVTFENYPKSQWLTANIPLYVFEGLNGDENIAQIIFSAAPVNESTLHIDNLLFWDDGSLTSDPLLSLQYGLNNDGSFNPGYSVVGADIEAFSAWEFTTGSDDVVMVVYDDGVDFSHPDLYDNRWVNPGEDLNGDGIITDADYNGIDDDGNGYPDDFWGWSSVYDDNRFLNSGSFHGTHVAGILGAQGDNGIGVTGVAQDVKIINVMIFNEFGGTDAISIMAGYQYISNLLDAGVDITGINQSWGGGGYLDLESDQQFISVMTDYALDHAEHAALWVVSAGNSASNRDELPFYSYPNNIQSPNLITVASTDDADNLSGFSDYGVFTVDVAAPGSSILSTLPPSTTGVEYGYLSGTSMASPHVSGILALAKAMYPNEDGFDLMTRVLAGNESVANLDGETGAGGRVNAIGAIEGGTEPISTGNTTQFHRTFVDGDALENTGLVNNTGGTLTVTGMTLSGPDAENFYIITEELPTLLDGEAFGISVGFDNAGEDGDLTATLEVYTDAGAVNLSLIGHEQGFAYLAIDNSYEDFGSVPYGEELSTTFNILNIGNSMMDYNIGQALYWYDLEWSQFIDSKTTYKAGKAPFKEVREINHMDFFDDLTAKVMLDRGDRTLPKIQYVPGSHRESDHLAGAEEVWFDDLNDADETMANWDLQSYGENEAYFNLVDISDTEGDTNNVFLFGDFELAYPNLAIPVAITPSFDFSLLETGRTPSYLVFDVEAELEDGYDYFYINAISNGSRLATIAGTFNGTIINYGGYYRAYVDISMFAGLDDLEFWFIGNTDYDYAGGFGVLFDNVSVIVDDAPFFTSINSGELAPGESEEVEIIVRTELIPAGDWVLYTDVYANGFISYYGNGGDYASHLTEFSARNVALEIDPTEQWLGEVSSEEATNFSFDASNVGTVGVDYFADIFIAYNQPVDFMNQDLSSGKEAALERFEASNKGPKESIDLVEHRNLVLDNLYRREGVSSNSAQISNIPRMSPSREDLDIYFEDFETGELNEGWDIFDFSFGLGHVWDVQRWGTVDNPDYFLNLGYWNENGWYIYDNTHTLAFSESFDLSIIPSSDMAVMELSYSFLLEPGYDFGSVWIGFEDENGVQLFYVGSSEDIFWNNGYIYRMGFDITEYTEFDNVFLAFLVETDQSVQSAFAGFDDLDVYSSESLAYFENSIGNIDTTETETMNATINTQWLWPGDYIAISVLDYYGSNEELFVSRSAEQFTYFEIPNQNPVAEDDYFASMVDEVIPFYEILDAMLLNDYDPEGAGLYLYDLEDPLHGDVKYTFDGPVYVAPESGGKVDMMRYVITDGQKMDTATVFISIGETPHFPVGADKQFVFLEDEEISMSTMGMAAGVGFWEDLFVWAQPHHTDLIIGHDADNHSITFTAAENAFGQYTATLYVGFESEVWDSMEVSLVVVPVNDAPVADFSTNIEGSVVTFTNLSNDALDKEAGGIIGYEWDFGDGTTSSEKDPSYDYGKIGDFGISLTVTDNDGVSTTYSETITILNVSNEVNAGIPTEFAIQQNYPNPFNPSTNINYSLPEASRVTIIVYDLLGQKVAELVNTEKSAGYHTIAFDASALSSGVYIYQIKAGAYTKTKKMMLIK